jgi:hypothetical protein
MEVILPDALPMEDIDEQCVPLPYLTELFKSFIGDFRAFVQILNHTIPFVKYTLGRTPLEQGTPEWLAHRSAMKFSFLQNVAAAPMSAHLKKTMTALPVDDFFEVIVGQLQELYSKAMHAGDMSLSVFANIWIVGCATHPDADVDRSLARRIRPRAEEVIAWTPRRSDYMQQLEAAATGEQGPFPGLSRAVLYAQICKTPLSPAELYRVVQTFWQLAIHAVDIWVYCNEASQELGADDALVLNTGEDLMVHHFRNVVANFFDVPLPVREVLNNTNYLGNIQFLLKHVVPQLLEHGVENEYLHSEMHKFMVEAMLDPITGLVDEFATVVESILGGLDFRHEAMPPEWRPPFLNNDDLSKDLHFYVRQAMPEPSEDLAVEATGPRNDPRVVSNPVETVPTGEICTVCQSELDSPTECVRLHTCTHLLHLDCLDRLINQAYTSMWHVACPMCRARICLVRDYRAVV